MIRAMRIIPALFLLFALTAGMLQAGYLQFTRNWLFDLYQRVAPAARTTDALTIVEIDEASLQRLGHWPWPRTVLARLIDATHGARALGLDLILAESASLPDEAPAATANGDQGAAARPALSPADDILARSIAAAPVVLPAAVRPVSGTPAGSARSAIPLAPVTITGADPGTGSELGVLPAIGAIVPPLASFAAAASGIGIASVPAEFDGVLRRIPLVFNMGGTPVASFAAEVLRVGGHSGTVSLGFGMAGVSRIGIGSLPVHTDQIGRIWPRYSRAVPASEISAWQVLDGSADPSLFRGRIVLIGATAAGLQDVVVTPLHQTVYGVVAHAQAIASVLAEDTLWRPPQMLLVELVLTLIAGVAAQLLVRRLGRLRYALLFGGAALLLIAASAIMFAARGLLLDWTFPLVAVAGTALLALAVQTRAEILTQRRREKDLSHALMTVEAANRAKTEFLTNVSHELRTPLGAVIGFSEVMSRQIMGPLSPVYADYANDIHKSGRHLLSVIDDILDLSAVELGGAQMRRERVCVAAALDDCQRMATPRAQQRGVALRTEIEPDLPDLSGDLRMLKQMVLNLVSNATKFAPRGTEIVIRAGLRDAWLCISVADQGRGIAPDDLARVTERFGRMQSERLTQEPGLGIGLAITKSMVELHGGRIALESEVGRGTTALLWFPPSAILKKESA